MPFKRDFMTRLGAKLDIPPEALPGSFGLTLCGDRELSVRGCKQILSYQTEEIVLLVGKKRLLVSGEGLCCNGFEAGSVRISGCIRTLSFEEV